MKIRSIIVAIIAVAAIAVIGCQKDPLVDTTEITTKQVTSITGRSAVSGGEITSDGTPTISKRGVCWSTSPEPTMNDYTVTHHNGGLGKFSVTMDGLSENTTYYVRAFAWNSTGAIYGEEYSFTTPYKPILSTLEAEEVTSVSAVCGGNITDDGNATITQRGLCWSTHENPTIEDSTSVVDSVGIGTFKSEMTKLTPGTLYYVRAYATNAAGTTYGEELSFTTLNVPVLKATEIANVTQETVVCSGSILDNAGADVTEQGFCWSTTPQPTTENEKITATAENGLGDFSITISGLQWGTTYYVRSYAIHAAGTSYGEETSFVTWKMATKNITDITVMSAVCGGTIEPLDAKGISEKGLCWSKISNPTIENEKIVSNGGTNNFSETISGLDEGETYYVRAYAINAVGTFYGEERIFTTLTVPTVETYNAEDVSYTTATAKAKVVADGGATVTERGFCYSTSNTNPTLSDSKITVGNGTGNFNYSFTGLTDNTTYYIRSYATNSVGTAYGSTINFTTTEITAPTVATTTATNVSYTSVTLGGNVTNENGATVTERGVCYSTSTNPTISNSKKAVGSGTGSFSIKITELNKNVTYYARAYAINSKGTSYGSVVSFTTTLVGAIQGEFSVSATKKVYFSQGNLQYQASTSIWRFAENQYDMIGSDNNSNISSSYSGWIDLFGWGTSGWNSGANAYQPYSTSIYIDDYYPGGSYSNSLTGSYANADWGVYNKISNGGNQAGLWRTLTKDEWQYLISDRAQASRLMGQGRVNNVNGLILLPDGWETPSSVKFTYDPGNYSTNVYSLDEWAVMQSYGAVFLPAAGYRGGTDVNY
ncbi:MAG: hypothetical protein J6X18_07820, partial [Bacteroidales bacterium]|nr:hypothetical protein [Bacteroidales bacterium]